MLTWESFKGIPKQWKLSEHEFITNTERFVKMQLHLVKCADPRTKRMCEIRLKRLYDNFSRSSYGNRVQSSQTTEREITGQEDLPEA
ncbi:MAG: DUF6965 family protein [Candidatus Hodarchaeales archaeon]